MPSFKTTFTIEGQDGEEIELEVWGTYERAEPGVGVFEPNIRFECAEDPARECGVELDPEQKERAVEALWDEWRRKQEKDADAKERAWEARAEMLREARR